MSLHEVINLAIQFKPLLFAIGAVSFCELFKFFNNFINSFNNWKIKGGK